MLEETNRLFDTHGKCRQGGQEESTTQASKSGVALEWDHRRLCCRPNMPPGGSSL